MISNIIVYSDIIFSNNLLLEDIFIHYNTTFFCIHLIYHIFLRTILIEVNLSQILCPGQLCYSVILMVYTY